MDAAERSANARYIATRLYNAKAERASVLSLNGQVKAQYAGPGGIQEIDQDAFFRPITVFNNTVTDPATAVKLLTRAAAEAVDDATRPVILTSFGAMDAAGETLDLAERI
ncbi:MAG TPA: thiamine pyrophosphate-binding protein [Candidatus Methanoculleus thermohydrogenotrophicum]|nr:thiamine pyrophosphate-binding protein [Candidatus Methanoculleus thermohydrogenotrophicum]HOB17259.1 thiamine pyrophosphate-binding protein [Candidatus Methanoculleus thermohydrogenotrophicum]HPZ37456.1 thiamine pyrophosphate-binding protein [Candidatus Methanoculleus thermohydrogenotrophicum]HQC90867.1 thiamine pyrophosphate-binding protein [Candidatus Methanoculleus thermohydrogenotrophicum]